MSPTYRVDDLIAALGSDTVTLVAGAAGGSREIATPHLHRPGLALVGHFFHHHPDRIQVLGETEVTFLASQPSAVRRDVLKRLAAEGVPAFVVTRGQTPPTELTEVASTHHVPLLVTPQSTGEFIRRTTRHLADVLAPRTTVHGVMIDVLGVGVLLSGPSGIGKSEAALGLVLRGHRLVADDLVELRLRPPDVLVGQSIGVGKHHMEIRGLGIINVQDLFGVAAVRDYKRLELVIILEPWEAGDEDHNGLGLEAAPKRSFLGLEVETIRIPVRPGRNLSDVIEVAARNRILKLRGVDSAQRFHHLLSEQIAARRGT